MSKRRNELPAACLPLLDELHAQRLEEVIERLHPVPKGCTNTLGWRLADKYNVTDKLPFTRGK